MVYARMAALSCIFIIACQDEGGLLVPDRGLVPRADARIQGHEEKAVTIAYEGEAVTLTLDASHSKDPDGRIAKFRWLSATRTTPGSPENAPAAGSGARSQRSVPDGAEPSWPDDVEQPQVTLEEGSHAFTLWVIDDRGLVSAPDTIRIDIQRMAP